MNRNYGLHLQEIVTDVHHAVTNLTEQDKKHRHQHLAGGNNNDTIHISELVDE